jgi:hypothetical protein
VSELPPLPTFLIIGAQKCGTRWLRSNLGLHPEIYAPDEELSFFSSKPRFREGLESYRAQFAGWRGEPIVGEATPGYMMWRHHPEQVNRRIRKSLPDVRLLAILRDPVDRAYSAFVHHRRHGRIPPDADFLSLVRTSDPDEDLLGLVNGGWYAASLRPFLKCHRGRIAVLFLDDVSDDAPGVYRRALRAVGADDVTFVPPGLGDARFSHPPDRPLTMDERAELHTYFADDIDQLEELVDRDLTSWRVA